MGDRGNIVVRQGDTNRDDVWFYTHWRGSDIKDIVQGGLARGKGRWKDRSYLARILFCSLVPQDDWDDETGFGISTGVTDNEHDIIVVDVPKQRVFIVPGKRGEKGDEDWAILALTDEGYIPDDFKPADGQSWTFEEFVALKEAPAEVE